MRTGRTAFPRPKRAAAVDARVSIASPSAPPPALLFLEEPALPACVCLFCDKPLALMKLATSLENIAKKLYLHLPPLLFALPLFPGAEGDRGKGGRVEREGAGSGGEGAQGFSFVSAGQSERVPHRFSRNASRCFPLPSPRPGQAPPVTSTGAYLPGQTYNAVRSSE